MADELKAWAALAAKELRGKPVREPRLGDARGHRRQAALHRRRPRGPRAPSAACPASRRSCAGRGRRCTPNRPWTIRQYAGFSTAEESNAFYRQNLAAGQMGLSVAFDLATHRGYDSDHPRVVGDVGKAGVAIDSVEDMKILFDGIPLDKMSVSMTMNGAVLPGARRLHRRRRGAGRRRRSSSAGPSRTTSSRSSWSATPTSTRPSRACGSSPTSSSTRRSTCRSSTRSRSPATTCRRPARPPMQELGVHASPTASSTCARRSPTGLDVDEFAGRLSLLLRHRHELLHGGRQAARRAAAVAPDHDASSSRRSRESLMLRTHCQTSGVSLTEQDPYNNIVRTTVEAHGRGARRHAEPAHQLVRRGARAADRVLGPHRPQHPADPRRGDRHHPRGRPARRQLLRRGAHRRAWPTRRGR